MDKDGAVAQQARAALSSTPQLSPAERARFAPDVPALLAALGGAGFNIPYYAEQCLNGLGAVAVPALPAFFQTLKSKRSFSLPLAEALVKLAEQKPFVYVPVINHYLFDMFYGVPALEQVAHAVRHRGQEAAALAPHLAAGLAGSDGEARAVAAALGALGAGVPALIKALRRRGHRSVAPCDGAARAASEQQRPRRRGRAGAGRVAVPEKPDRADAVHERHHAGRHHRAGPVHPAHVPDQAEPSLQPVV